MRIYRHIKAETSAPFQDGRCGGGGSGLHPSRFPEPPWSRRPGSRAYFATRKRAKRYTLLLRKGNHETLFGKGFPVPGYGLHSGPPCAECSCVDRNEFTFRVPADTAGAQQADDAPEKRRRAAGDCRKNRNTLLFSIICFNSNEKRYKGKFCLSRES
jgi:hypothetical protein